MREAGDGKGEMVETDVRGESEGKIKKRREEREGKQEGGRKRQKT